MWPFFHGLYVQVESSEVRSEDEPHQNIFTLIVRVVVLRQIMG